MRNLFHLTRSERRGLYALSIILVLLLIIKLSIPYWPYKKIEEFNHQTIASKIDSLENSNIKNEATKNATPVKKDSLFYFDPNQLNSEGWQSLGLSKKRTAVIVNYRNKGGVFYQKEDLQKIYSIDSQFYTKVAPYIKIITVPKKISSKLPTKKNISIPVQKNKSIIVNINTCDKEELQNIDGIGPVYSERIIKYRNILGGFSSKNQLLEVYGIDQEIFQTINKYIAIDTINIKKINLNTDNTKHIAKHPYIKWNLAKLIVNYRLRHGKYSIKEELLNLELIDSITFIKIQPYIKL